MNLSWPFIFVQLTFKTFAWILKEDFCSSVGLYEIARIKICECFLTVSKSKRKQIKQDYKILTKIFLRLIRNLRYFQRPLLWYPWIFDKNIGTNTNMAVFTTFFLLHWEKRSKVDTTVFLRKCKTGLNRYSCFRQSTNDGSNCFFSCCFIRVGVRQPLCRKQIKDVGS